MHVFIIYDIQYIILDTFNPIQYRKRNKKRARALFGTSREFNYHVIYRSVILYLFQ